MSEDAPAQGNPKLSFAEENNAEVLSIRQSDEQARMSFASQHKSDLAAERSGQQQYLAKTGQLPPSDETLTQQAEQRAVSGIAAKKTQDANGTWSITKAAASAHRPEKPYVAAARAEVAAARAAHQSAQSPSTKPR